MAMMNRPVARPAMQEPKEDISGMLLKKQAAQALADTQNRVRAANPPSPPPTPAQRVPPQTTPAARPPGMKKGGKVRSVRGHGIESKGKSKGKMR